MTNFILCSRLSRSLHIIKNSKISAETLVLYLCIDIGPVLTLVLYLCIDIGPVSVYLCIDIGPVSVY